MNTAADNRDVIRTALDETVFVEAAAGTGKTTELVNRIVRLIETRRARIGEIAALTFSEKAAGELKLRLREELERARERHPHDAPESALLTAAVHDFEDAHVSTIHGFCAELLRERPVEARVDPAFEVLTEPQADARLADAFDDWIQRALEHPGEGVRRSLRRPSRWVDDEEPSGPIERLRAAARELCEWRDHGAPWTRPDYDRRAAIRALVDELKAFADLTRRPLKKGDAFHVDTAPARLTHDEIARLMGSAADLSDEVWDSCEAALVKLADDRDFARSRKGSGAAFAAGVTRAAAHDAHVRLLQSLKRFKQTADADLAALLRDELRDCLERYEHRKRDAGALDYLDLLIKARDLVRDTPDVRRRLQARFRAVLVDEFQDTDPLQAELLLLVAGNEHGRVRPGALFIVGDPKQSIYRFRRADVGAYMRLTEQLRDEGATPVTMHESFRSGPGIQRFVNAAFAPEMTGDPRALQASYVALGPHRQDAPGQPSVIALPVPRPYGKYDVTLKALEESQPAAVAEFIRWMVSPDCPWTVEVADPAKADGRVRRAITPSDACILFRRFSSWTQDVTRPYVEALEARGIPHLLVGGKSFHEREEVDVIRVALTAIEWPEDELSVYATLHGPLVAIGEEELLEYHAVARIFHPYRVPNDLPGRLQPIAEALHLLKDLHAERNLRPVADTIGRLLAATRAHAGFVLWRGGEQVLANVLHISDLARRYEAEGGISFRGFVEWLREAAERAEAPEAPILEEGSEGVRLMTVHKAKGLEFPVVVLADIGCRLSRDQASRHLDTPRGLCAVRIGGWAPLDLIDHNAEEAAKDEAEAVRLAYVAATRARDLLVVVAVGDGPHQPGWLRPLNRALYPPVERRQSPRSARGVPLFKGKDTVLLRPDGRQPDEGTVRPGAYELHDPASGEPYTVVWWDPLLLEGTGDAPRGLRREELISKDADPSAVAADRARYDAWTAKRASAIAAGSRPSISIITATEWARAAGAATPDSRLPAPVAGSLLSAVDPASVLLEDVGVVEERPSGRRFGILVHAVLATVPFDAGADVVRRLADVHLRVLAATGEERSAAAAIVDRVLKHRVIDEARAALKAGRPCRREVPVSIVIGAPQAPAARVARAPEAPGAPVALEAPGVLEPPALIDGQADLAYETDAGWVVVDFKTDAEIAGAEEIYRRQVALYAHAVARATGKPAQGILLRV